MSPTIKLILAVAAGLLVVCLAGTLVFGLAARRALPQLSGRSYTEPDEIERAARKIMAFSVPDDLEPKLAYEFLTFRTVTYSGTDEISQLIIYEAQADPSASDAEIQSQIEDTAAEDTEWMVDSRQIGVEHVTIAGRTVAVGIYESDLPEENNYRMASTILRTAPDRVVLAMLVRPIERWSLVEVRALFSSIQP